MTSVPSEERRGVARRWRRVAAGVYERDDRQRRIICTRWEDAGPKGGTRWLWELASPDEYSGWVIDSPAGDRTLREAKAADRETDR